MISPNFQRELSAKDVLGDAIISIALILTAWATKEIGAYLFPDGVPFPQSLILVARDIATLLWVVGTTARYFWFAYCQINATINEIFASRIWNESGKAVSLTVKKTYCLWTSLDRVSQKLTLLILIVVLSFFIFSSSNDFFDLLVPPVYWAVSFCVGHVLEGIGRSNFRPRKSYWLAVLLLFLIIEILIFINSVYIIDNRILFDISDIVKVLIVLCVSYLYICNRYQKYKQQFKGTRIMDQVDTYKLLDMLKGSSSKRMRYLAV